MAGTVIWGVFLIAVGLGLLVFNKPYAAFVGRLLPGNPYAQQPFGRPLVLVLGVVLMAAGGSALASPHG